MAERRSAIRALHQELRDSADGDVATREACYLSAHEDAQHTVVVTHGLMRRYHEITALPSCQQEPAQPSCDYRRG